MYKKTYDCPPEKIWFFRNQIRLIRFFDKSIEISHLTCYNDGTNVMGWSKDPGPSPASQTLAFFIRLESAIEHERVKCIR